MHCFYVLKSKKDHDLYYGFSDHLRARLIDHNKGSNASTKYRRPFVLVYYEAYASKVDAMNREWQIKKNGKAYAQLKRRIEKSIHEA